MGPTWRDTQLPSFTDIIAGMAASARILIVDDEPAVVDLIDYNLTRQGFQTVTANDGPAALRLMQEHQPDLIVLDLMLPGMHGHDVCRELRKTSTVPIIILTAQGEEIDRVLGLELGADDYLCKPFSVRELIARIKAVLRRGPAAWSGTAAWSGGGMKTIACKGLTLEPESRTARIGATVLDLTRIEFDLLLALMNPVERVLSREQLLQQVWGYAFYGDARAVDSSIKRLRAKIRMVDVAADGLIAVRGVGYKFSATGEG